MANGPITRCIDCGAKIQFDEQPRLGMLVVCDECGTELEVVRKSPLELDWPYVDDEDEDDDDFEYDDFEDDDFEYDDEEFEDEYDEEDEDSYDLD